VQTGNREFRSHAAVRSQSVKQADAPINPHGRVRAQREQKIRSFPAPQLELGKARQIEQTDRCAHPSAFLTNRNKPIGFR